MMLIPVCIARAHLPEHILPVVYEGVDHIGSLSPGFSKRRSEIIGCFNVIELSLFILIILAIVVTVFVLTGFESK